MFKCTVAVSKYNSCRKLFQELTVLTCIYNMNFSVPKSFENSDCACPSDIIQDFYIFNKK